MAPRDPPGRPWLALGGLLVGLGALLLARRPAARVRGRAICGLFALLWRFHRVEAGQPPLTAQQGAAITPPGPPLQSDPFRDIGALRERETRLLTTYAWLDADRRRARIPIARAQALVVGRPLDPGP